MAVSDLSFLSQIDDWVRRTEQRMTAVFRESTQRVVSIAANGVPVDTGFARASIRASNDAMPSIDPSAKGSKRQAYDAAGAMGDVTMVIAGSEIGQTVYVGWTAAYVLPLEYGYSKQAPSGFVRLAAAQWMHTVDQVIQEAKARAAR